MDGITFAVVDAASASARGAMTEYFDELAARFPAGFDSAAALTEAVSAFNPPRGVFVLVGPVDAPIGCGAVQFLDSDRGEIKRMWVDPTARGRGVASALLAFLEEVVRGSGRATAVLDTNHVLAEAAALYKRRGYQPIDRYNDNPYADRWYSKSLLEKGFATPAGSAPAGTY